MNCDHDDRICYFNLADDRLFGQRRERKYRVDPGLDLAHDLVEIRIQFYLGGYGSGTLPCR